MTNLNQCGRRSSVLFVGICVLVQSQMGIDSTRFSLLPVLFSYPMVSHHVADVRHARSEGRKYDIPGGAENPGESGSCDVFHVEKEKTGKCRLRSDEQKGRLVKWACLRASLIKSFGVAFLKSKGT